MKVNFEVTGKTADDLNSEALRLLNVLNPKAKWRWDITVRPLVTNGRGEITSWTGEVDAYDLTEREQ